MMRHQPWRMFGLGLGIAFAVCVGHPALAAPDDDDARPAPKAKTIGGPAKAAKPARNKLAPEAAYEASKQAYEALPLADRKAVQDALVWVGAYKGTVDGTFGKRTRDALIVFEKRDKRSNADGIIDKNEFDRLVAAAKRAKDAVRFTMVDDEASGMRFGLPLRLLTKRTPVAGGTRYASADGRFLVETKAVTAVDAEIGQLYDKLRADDADRQVTYKASRPDWFVVSGELGEKHFYSRFDHRPGGAANEIRGYTILYDAADATRVDRYSIAITNSAEPFPGASAKVAAKEAAPDKLPAPPPPLPPKMQFSATGVLVAPNRAVTVLPDGCAGPASAKKPLTILASDKASGLTLIEASAGQPLAAAASEPAVATGASLVIVGFSTAGGGAALAVASGEALQRTASDGRQRDLRVFAPLQTGAGGSAVFDRVGTFRGLIGRLASKPRLVAGIVPQASYPVIDGATLAKFMAAANVTAADPPAPARNRTAGEIAQGAAAALIPIDCTR